MLRLIRPKCAKFAEGEGLKRPVRSQGTDNQLKGLLAMGSIHFRLARISPPGPLSTVNHLILSLRNRARGSAFF